MLVLTGYGALAIVGVVFTTASLRQGVLSGLIVVALLALQLGFLSRPDRTPRPPWGVLALAAQAVLVFLPIAQFGPVWHGLPGFLAGSALLVLSRVAGVVAFVLVIAAIAVISAAEAPVTELLDGITAQVYVVTSATTCGLAVYGLSALVRLALEARDAREELRRVAVARERVQLARDVHEVLGQNLSAIALRGELVARLMDTRPAQARAELAEVLVLSRRALADVREVVGIRREVEHGAAPREPEGPVDYAAPRLGRAMLGGVLVCLSAVAVVAMAQEQGPLAAAVLAAARAAMIVLLLVVTRWRVAPPVRTRVLVLLLLAGAAYLPMPFLGPIAHASDALVAGAALLLLPRSAGLAVAVLVWVGGLVIEAVDPGPTTSLLYSLAYGAVGSVLVTLLIYGLGSMPRLVVQLEEARTELADAAAAAERMRVARDVHDLLGLGLSAITLKCELADRLMDRSIDRARAEVSEVLVAARTALSDVRSAIGGDRELSLDDEWRAVVATLEAAAVQVRTSREGVPPEGSSGTVLATVLREGATNVLRHSSAEWCEITIRRRSGSAELEIVNDGVRSGGAAPLQGGSGGSGLSNMAARLGSLGGELDTTVDGEIHRLRARIPVPG